MKTFNSDGVRIAYRDEGEGDSVLLIHGFGSNVAVNWAGTGWMETLKRAGFRVIALDNRGHGQSEKLYDPAAYGAPIMAEDASRLLDHLLIDHVDVMGYSMGARISAFLTLNRPECVRSVIFAGMGINLVHGLGGVENIVAALEAPGLDDTTDPTARAFRQFADQTGSDRRALAACMRSSREPIRPEMLAMIDCPVLVAVGSADDIAGSGPELAALIPGAKVLDITGRDHMKAVGDPVYKRGVLDFLARRP